MPLVSSPLCICALQAGVPVQPQATPAPSDAPAEAGSSRAGQLAAVTGSSCGNAGQHAVAAAQDDPAAKPAVSSPNVVSPPRAFEVVASAKPAMLPPGRGNLQGESAAALPGMDEAGAAADQQQLGKQARLAEVKAAPELRAGEGVAQGGPGSLTAGVASSLPASKASGCLLGLAAAHEPQGTAAKPEGVRLELAGPGAPAVSPTAGEQQQSPAASADCLGGSRPASPLQVPHNAMKGCSGSKSWQGVAPLPLSGQLTSSEIQLGPQRSRLTMSDEVVEYKVLEYPGPAAACSDPLGRGADDVRTLDASCLGGPGSDMAGQGQALQAGPGSLPWSAAAPVPQQAQMRQRSNSPAADSAVFTAPASAEGREPPAAAAPAGSLPQSAGSQHQQQPSGGERSGSPAAAAVAAAVAVAAPAVGRRPVRRRQPPAKAHDCLPEEGHARRAGAAAAAGQPPVQRGGRPAQATAARSAAAPQGSCRQRLTEIAAPRQQQQGVNRFGQGPRIRALQQQQQLGSIGLEHYHSGGRSAQAAAACPAAAPQEAPGQRLTEKTAAAWQQQRGRDASGQEPKSRALQQQPGRLAGVRQQLAVAALPQHQVSTNLPGHHTAAPIDPAVLQTLPDIEQVQSLAQQAQLAYKSAVEALLKTAEELQKLPGVQQFLHRVQDDVQVGGCLASCICWSAGTAVEPAEASSMHMEAFTEPPSCSLC